MKHLWIFPLILLFGCSKVYSPLDSSQAANPAYSSQAGIIDTFESGPTVDNFGYQNTVYTDTIALDGSDPGPSTMTYADVPGNTLPGGTPGHAVELKGTMQQNIDWPNGGYPYCFFNMALSAYGTNVTSMAPSGQLVFAYKASAGDVGQAHRIVIQNYPITNYNWYLVTFTPLDTNWHWATCYFPIAQNSGKPASQTFATAFFNPTPAPPPWSQVETAVTDVYIMPFSGASAPFNFDFTIDDVRFQ